MQGHTYTIKLMRDDGEARTFRVSGRGVTWAAAAAFALGLAVCSALGLGLHSFIGVQRLEAERGGLEERLADMLVQLERKRNLQLLSTDPPRPPSPRSEARPAPAAQPPARVDTGVCALAGLELHRSGAALSVAFDLVNRGRGEASGRIRLLLLRGASAPAGPDEAASITYRIQRRKHVTARLRPPKGLGPEDIRGLRVEVTDAAGAVLLVETAAVTD